MEKYLLDICFVLSLIILYFIPRKSEKYKLFWLIPAIIFFVNLGIRVHLIHQKHNSSEKILELENKLSRVSPRELTQDQKNKLSKLLAFQSKFQIIIACRMMDEESLNYAEQISEVFQKANCNVGPTNRSFLDNIQSDTGIAVTDDSQQDDAKKISAIFNSIGIKCQAEMIREKSISGVQQNTIYLIVGSKLKRK